MGISDYVKENLKKGYSDINIKIALAKQGYSHDEIEDAFEMGKEPGEYRETLGFYTAMLLVMSWGNVMLVLPLIIASFVVVSKGVYLVYALMLFAGLLGGWLCSAVTDRITKKGGFRSFAGVIVPVIPLEIIFGLYFSLQKLESVTIPGNLGPGFIPIIPSSFANPLLMGLVYYVSFNIFFILSNLGLKKKTGLLVYAAAPAVFYGIWLLVDFGLTKAFALAGTP